MRSSISYRLLVLAAAVLTALLPAAASASTVAFTWTAAAERQSNGAWDWSTGASLIPPSAEV
jgi:hypothetical protein